MKTNCPVCKKTSVNLLHKESGSVYCMACGSQMSLSIAIVNQLAKAGLFLPKDFFKDAPRAAPTPSVQQPPVRGGGRIAADPLAAAAARRASMQQQLDNLAADSKTDGGRPSFRGSGKISREQAAADKESIRQSLRSQADGAYEPIRENTAPPDIYADIEQQGINLSRLERDIDPD